jgi:hypothetical protein
MLGANISLQLGVNEMSIDFSTFWGPDEGINGSPKNRTGGVG